MASVPTSSTTTQDETVRVETTRSEATQNDTNPSSSLHIDILRSFKRTEPAHKSSFGTLIRCWGRWSFWNVIGEVGNVWLDLVHPGLVEILRENRCALLRHMRGKGVKEPHYSLKCCMIGLNKDFAGPHVVVICRDRNFGKSVRRLVIESALLKEAGWGKKACLPLRTNILQAMEISVEDSKQITPPEIKSTITHDLTIFAYKSDKPRSLLGLTITSRGRNATLGGAILVDDKLYGLTVAHPFQEDFENESSSENVWADEFDESDLDIFTSDVDDEEYSEAPLGVSSEDESFEELEPDTSHNHNISSLPLGTSNDDDNLYPIGILNPKTHCSSNDAGGACRNLDWALISIADVQLHQNNSARLSSQGKEALIEDIKITSILQKMPEEGAEILVITGSQGIITANSCASPIILNLGRSCSMDEAWAIRTDDIMLGDCGSWVLDSTCHNLIGVICGTAPALSEAYVTPFKNIIQDINLRGLGMVKLWDEAGSPRSTQHPVKSDIIQQRFKAESDIPTESQGYVKSGFEKPPTTIQQLGRFAPAISALARQTMRAAFEDLEKTVTPSDARDFRAMTLAHVRKEAIIVENQLAARKTLRNVRRLALLFRGLEHFGKAVEILCNGTPFLTWIWAPITIVLRVASEYIEAFELLMKGYTRLAECLQRFDVLSDELSTNADFQQIFAVIYADILQFHKHTYRLVRRSGWRLLFLTSWGRFQRRFDNLLEDLGRHGDILSIEINTHNFKEVSRMRQEVRTWREGSLLEVEQDEEDRAVNQHRAVMSWLKIDESEQLAIYDSILQDGNKFPGSLTWVANHSIIRSWLQQKFDSTFVWLQGTPGSGKSTICAQLVNYINMSNSLTIHHFCTHLYPSSTKYDHILKSMLLQLLRGNGELVAHVYRECVLGKKLPFISTIERLLQSLCFSLSNEPSKSQHFWLILDGLDECEASKVPRLLNLLSQLTTGSTQIGTTVCKILVSSRSSFVLSKYLRRKLVISLSDESVQLNNAIRNYSSQRLQISIERLRQLELERNDLDALVDKIAAKADGMFLYARLVLDYVTSNIFYSGDEILQSVSQLPPTLAEFYQKILTQMIASLDARSVGRVKSILSWVAFARRPLKKLELLSALSFEQGNTEVKQLVPRYILDICSPLLEERQDDAIRFIHRSVKEFLESPSSSVRISKQEAAREQGISAISCLLNGVQVFDDHFDEHIRLSRLVRGVHGFHVYATEFWVDDLLAEAAYHGKLSSESPLLTLALQFVKCLHQISTSGDCHIVDSDASESDERMEHLRPYPILYDYVLAALKSRSRKSVDLELFQPQDTKFRSEKGSLTNDAISRMLQAYQSAVESLLNVEFYPGVSSEELTFFKSQFRTSAFTCRLHTCPRATLGFENATLRYEHEITHTSGFRCTYADCQYPPFKSAQALKSHVSTHHILTPTRKSIRGTVQGGLHSRPSLEKSPFSQEVSSTSPPQTTIPGPPNLFAVAPSSRTPSFSTTLPSLGLQYPSFYNTPYGNPYSEATTSPSTPSGSLYEAQGEALQSLSDSRMSPTHISSVTLNTQKRAYRQRRKDPSCDACRDRKVKCDATETTACSECSSRSQKCKFTKETNRRISSIKQVQDLQNQLAELKQEITHLRTRVSDRSSMEVKSKPSPNRHSEARVLSPNVPTSVQTLGTQNFDSFHGFHSTDITEAINDTSKDSTYPKIDANFPPYRHIRPFHEGLSSQNGLDRVRDTRIPPTAAGWAILAATESRQENSVATPNAKRKRGVEW